MNINDEFAREQTLLWSAMFHLYWPVFLLQFALFVVTCWVIYKFYARLRDIADEVKKLRIVYERSNPPHPSSSASQPSVTQAPASQAPANEDGRYMPKK